MLLVCWLTCVHPLRPVGLPVLPAALAGMASSSVSPVTTPAGTATLALLVDAADLPIPTNLTVAAGYW